MEPSQFKLRVLTGLCPNFGQVLKKDDYWKENEFDGGAYQKELAQKIAKLKTARSCSGEKEGGSLLALASSDSDWLSGGNLLRETTQIAAARRTKMLIQVFIIFALRIAIIFVLKAFDKEKDPFNYEWDGALFQILSLGLHFLFFPGVIFFVMCGITDFKRRLYSLNLMTTLI